MVFGDTHIPLNLLMKLFSEVVCITGRETETPPSPIFGLCSCLHTIQGMLAHTCSLAINVYCILSLVLLRYPKPTLKPKFLQSLSHQNVGFYAIILSFLVRL